MLGLSFIPGTDLQLFASAHENTEINQDPAAELFDCFGRGDITYEIKPFDLDNAEKKAKISKKMVSAMDAAVARYNCYTDLQVHIKVFFDPKVPTANGSWFLRRIKFGNIDMIHKITAMHEIAHVVGIGSSFDWKNLVKDSRFIGQHLSALLSNTDGMPEHIYADDSHFWPYGLNQASEVKSERDLLNHCLLVAAMKKDLDASLSL